MCHLRLDKLKTKIYHLRWDRENSSLKIKNKQKILIEDLNYYMKSEMEMNVSYENHACFSMDDGISHQLYILRNCNQQVIYIIFRGLICWALVFSASLSAPISFFFSFSNSSILSFLLFLYFHSTISLSIQRYFFLPNSNFFLLMLLSIAILII